MVRKSGGVCVKLVVEKDKGEEGEKIEKKEELF